MKVILNENGVALGDYAVQSYIDEKLSKREDIHVSQLMTIDVLRATLLKMPIEDRPEIEWEFYGEDFYYDKDLRTPNHFNDPRLNVWEDALLTLCGWK